MRKKGAGAGGIAVRRILVPTDFSRDADLAVRWAVRLGTALKAEVTVLFVLDLSLGAVAGLPPEMASMYATGDLLAQVRREAVDEMAVLGRRYPRVKTLIREGSPRPTILRTANRLRADLIVIGTHGRTGLAHVVFGSVAEHVVRYARMPVLTVRKTRRS
ncbi:MAG TPA: universal stress protein [bacterium]|jgi:nucleotide-binding universal stress UspA family protein|nr:universal stress protein [bacterium]